MIYPRRKVLMGASALLAAPWLGQTAFAEMGGAAYSTSVGDPVSYVNPEFRAPLASLATAPTMDAEQLRKARSWAKNAAPLPLLAGVTEHFVPESKRAPKVRVFVVGDSSGASKPAVLHIHGGGFVVMSGAITQAEIELVKNLDCVVVSVDYRLAPETKFPGSLEDNYAALRWMYENAKQLGIDPARIAVKGESAGGGHAAMLTLAIRERKEFALCHQVLIYPVLDDRTGSTRKVPPYIGHFVWTAESNRFAWTSLLGVPAGSKTVPIDSVPARVENLEGLPPAFIGVGSIDLFAPEDIEYSRRLLESGVPTELLVIPGGYHGFDIFCPDASLSVQFKSAWTDALRRSAAAAPMLATANQNRTHMNLTMSQLLGRDFREDEPNEVGVSTLKNAFAAIDRGDLAEAKRIVEYARLEWQVVHDMYVNWSWAFFTYIAQTYGEQELEKAMRFVLESYYKGRYDKVMASDIRTQLQLCIEGLRGHLMGPGHQGEVEVTEEQDRYKLTLNPCSSGGVARQRVESGAETNPQLYGFSKEAHPWTWNKERVCYYCAHCAMVNEVLAIENYGHPMRITEYPKRAEDPCVWYIYKNPKDIPAEYYERVGKNAPSGAPRLKDKEP